MPRRVLVKVLEPGNIGDFYSQLENKDNILVRQIQDHDLDVPQQTASDRCFNFVKSFESLTIATDVMRPNSKNDNIDSNLKTHELMSREINRRQNKAGAVPVTGRQNNTRNKTLRIWIIPTFHWVLCIIAVNNRCTYPVWVLILIKKY